MHVTIISGKESNNLKEGKERCLGGFGWRKEKGEILQLRYNLKNKTQFLKDMLLLKCKVLDILVLSK